MAEMLHFDSCLNLVRSAGKHVTFLFEGEPGIGKSTIGKALAGELGYEFAYMDMANMSL